MSLPQSTIIIGGGVVGVCSAYYLAKRGHKVTLIEKNSIDDGASKGNAGIIALGHPPLPRPGLVWQTVKWMLDKGSPLYVPPRVDFSLMKWMWQFRTACTSDHFQHCMRILAEWGWATGRCWDKIIEDEKIECEYHTTGWMDIFRTREGMERGLHEADLLREHDFEVKVLTGDELRAQQPAFRQEIVGAAHYVDSRFANPRMFVVELAKRLDSIGVKVMTSTEVSQINVSGGRFQSVRLGNGQTVHGDALVLAAGVWTTPLAQSIGINVPIQAGKGYHVNITPPDPCPTIACVLNETFVAVTPMGGGLRLAGTVELSGINHHMIQKRLDMLSEGAKNYLQGIEQTRIESSWCGLRPCTADGLPVIGWAPTVDGVFIASGHAKYGFAYGPITGRLVCECILDGKPSLDLSAMRVDRFSKRSGIKKVSPHMREAAPRTAGSSRGR